MKFLCLICAEKVMEQMAPDAAAALFDEYMRFTEDIRSSGHFVDCNRLLPPSAAITVRSRDGKVSTTDGPFVETKEALGGFYLLEADDLDQAITMAKMVPARFGGVEVRPVMVFPEG
jgi:hypothetical protein